VAEEFHNVEQIQALSTSKPPLDFDIQGRALPVGSTAASSLPNHGSESSRPSAGEVAV